jgi:hypothetical protein
MIGADSIDDFFGLAGNVATGAGIGPGAVGASVAWNNDFSVVVVEYSVGPGAGIDFSLGACYTRD